MTPVPKRKRARVNPPEAAADPSQEPPATSTLGVLMGLAGDVVAVPRRLPRGLSSLPQDVVLMSQRSRLIEATARAVAEKGYAAATVADIISGAGVSRTTFYQLFKDKEECFLYCYENLAQAHLELVVQGLHNEQLPLPERLVDALGTYLRRIDADRWYARAFIAEAEAASPPIRQAQQQARARIGQALRDWFDMVRTAHPEVPAQPPALFELVQTGLTGYVTAAIREQRQPLESVVRAMASFIFAGFGLYGWARHVLAEETRIGGLPLH